MPENFRQQHLPEKKAVTNTSMLRLLLCFLCLLLLTQLPPRGSSQPRHPTNVKGRPALLPQEESSKGSLGQSCWRDGDSLGPTMPAHTTGTTGDAGCCHRGGGPHLHHHQPAPQVQAHCHSAGQAGGAHSSGQRLLLSESTLTLSDKVLQATGRHLTKWPVLREHLPVTVLSQGSSTRTTCSRSGSACFTHAFHKGCRDWVKQRSAAPG